MRCLLLTFKQYTAKTYRNYVFIVEHFCTYKGGAREEGRIKVRDASDIARENEKTRDLGEEGRRKSA